MIFKNNLKFSFTLKKLGEQLGEQKEWNFLANVAGSSIHLHHSSQASDNIIHVY